MPDGYYLNPAAYHGAGAAASWGNAGRNSVTRPAQFSLNAGDQRGRSRWGERFNMDWRDRCDQHPEPRDLHQRQHDAEQLAVRVADSTNHMRKITTSVRVRF